MIDKRLILLVLFVILATAQEPNPEVTQLDYFGQYSLGKQDQLNKTFTIVQDKLAPLPDITYNYDEQTSYRIFNFTQPTFFVIDSRQKAQIGDNRSITITGSVVETTISFSWQRIVNKVINLNGTGSTRGKSQNIIFTKQLIWENDTAYYNLTFFGKILYTPLQLTRIEPATATFQDQNSIKKLLNHIMDHTSVASQLQQNIDKIYSYYLRNYLHDDRHHFTDFFTYHWVDPVKSKGQLSIEYQTHLYQLQLDRTALKMQWRTKIKDYGKYIIYNYTLPHPFDSRAYGLQQFTSMGLIKNTVMYALEHDMFNTQLSKQNWQSRFFQFYAGDLYEVIPKISEEFLASEQAKGRCQANRLNFDVKKGSHQDRLNVSLSFDCEISISRKKVNDFVVQLVAEIKGVPNTDTVDFYVVGFDFVANFNNYLSYKVQNQALAKLMVKHSLNRLYQTKVFGSGWKTFTRDYPHFMVEQNCTVLWDSSHIGPMVSTNIQ